MNPNATGTYGTCQKCRTRHELTTDGKIINHRELFTAQRKRCPGSRLLPAEAKR